MDSAVPITVVSAALGSGVLAAALLYVSCAERAHPALRWWTAAFVVNTLRYCLMLLAPQLGPALGTFLQEATAVGYAALLLAGSFLYFGRAIPRASLAGAVAALTGWAGAGAWLDLPLVARVLPISLMLGAAMISIGIAFLRARGDSRVENRIVGACFAIWGLHIFNFPFLRNCCLVRPVRLSSVANPVDRDCAWSDHHHAASSAERGATRDAARRTLRSATDRERATLQGLCGGELRLVLGDGAGSALHIHVGALAPRTWHRSDLYDRQAPRRAGRYIAGAGTLAPAFRRSGGAPAIPRIHLQAGTAGPQDAPHHRQRPADVCAGRRVPRLSRHRPRCHGGNRASSRKSSTRQRCCRP